MTRGKRPRTLILYEPQFNHETKVTVKLLTEMLGVNESTVSKYVNERRVIKHINCYLFRDRPTVAEKRKLIRELKLKNEQWRESKLPNLYISNKGRFRAKTKTGWRYYFPYKFKNTLQIKYKQKEYKANRLVYETWHGEIPENHCVYAKNGIKHEITASNLKLVTREELGKLTGYKSKSREVALLDDHGEIIEEFRSTREAARNLYVSHQAVSDSCNNKWNSKAGGVYNFKWLEEVV